MYDCYAQSNRSSGGSSIAINKRYFQSQINLKPKLQAVVICLYLHKTISLCSVYIPANYKLQPFNLESLQNSVNSFQLHS